MAWWRKGWLVSLIAGFLFLAGCQQAPNSGVGHWSGPQALCTVSMEEVPKAPGAVLIHTPHYKIYSTMTDHPDLLQKSAQVMEGAFAQYQQLAPGMKLTDFPLDCYLFATREQWTNFTRAKAPGDVNTYLKINRGGYSVLGWYVAYYIGDASTLSVASHEGFHQFVYRNLKNRIPPFLEEGMACMFEEIRWDGDLPRWNLSANPARLMSLRRASDAHELFPLAELIKLHAGLVVNQAGIKIEAFYGQNWAFARFMWEAENGKYRPVLQHLLTDAGNGTLYDPTGSQLRPYLPWNPAGVQPMLEHYFGEKLPQIEASYRQFVQKIAYEEYNEQFSQ